MEKLLTISIAAYNTENSIRKALDSLIDKRIIDYLEIFVVDDGGTDDTLKISNQYAQQYPQSIFPIHKKNGGYGSTINTSIVLATGKYFKLLDGDDWFQTENLIALVEIMKQQSVDCILSNHIRHNRKSNQEEIIDSYQNVKEGKQDLEDSKISCKLGMYDVAFSTEILKKMEPVTEHCFYTDLEFATYAVPFLSSIYMFHRPVYVYQIGQAGQSMSLEGIKSHYEDASIVFWDLCEVYKNIPKSKPVQKNIMLDAAAHLFQLVITFYCVLPYSKRINNEMIRFAGRVKDMHPEFIEQAKKTSSRVNLLESTHYKTYPLVSLLTKIKWKI